MAYVFAFRYLNQYPAEKVAPSTFACDTTIRNAKFSSSLQPLSIPLSDVEQTISDLLDEQNLTLNIDFINTRLSCTELSVVTVVDSFVVTNSNTSCSSSNGVLSISIALSAHKIVVRVLISSVSVIGGVRVGMMGAGQEKERYQLKELDFRHALYSPSARTLGQSPIIQMSMTKVSHSSTIEIELLLINESYAYFYLPRQSMKQNLCMVVNRISKVFGIQHWYTVSTPCSSHLTPMSD